MHLNLVKKLNITLNHHIQRQKRHQIIWHFPGIQHYGIPVIITHCCNNYGPWQLIEKFIPLAISKAFTNQEIPIYGSGKNIREWIHVDDHCKALFEIMLKGKVGERYLIGVEKRFAILI